MNMQHPFVLLVVHSGTGMDGSGFILLLILVCNLSAAKCIAPCEATEPVKYVTCKYVFLF